MSKIAHNQIPWAVGRVLRTQATRELPQSALEELQEMEQCEVYRDFHAEDQGRGRKLICRCRTKEDAAFIVKAVNNHKRLVEIASMFVVLARATNAGNVFKTHEDDIAGIEQLLKEIADE